MMKRFSIAVAGRPVQRWHRWLRHAWVSQVTFLDRLTDELPLWLPLHRAGDRSAPPQRRPKKPDFEIFENRETANDVLSILGTSVVASGLGVLTGDLLTPATVLLSGWSGGRSVTVLPDAAVISREIVGLTLPAITHPVSVPAITPDLSPQLERDSRPAVPNATVTTPVSSALVIAPEMLRNPLGDDWLNAVSAALSARPQHNGEAPPDARHPRTVSGENVASGASPATFPGNASPTPAQSSADHMPAAQNLAALIGLPSSLLAPPILPPLARTVPISGSSALGLTGTPTISAPLSQAAPATAPTAKQPLTTAEQATLLQDYGRLPLSFEPNLGQTDPQAHFLTHGLGYNLFLTGDGAVVALSRPGTSATPRAATDTQPVEDVLRLQFVGADPNVQPTGLQEQPGRSNYFIGADASAWQTNVPQYGQVRYHNLYPGIDAVWYGISQQQLEYDLVLAPGADPGAIQFRAQGATEQVDAQGNLLLQTAGGTLIQQAPVLYQQDASGRHPVPGGYALAADGTIRFQVGAHDATQPLYLDPVLNTSTVPLTEIDVTFSQQLSRGNASSQAAGIPAESEASCLTNNPSPTPWRSRHTQAPNRPQAARFRAGSTSTARPLHRTTPVHCPLRAA
jgi:hypothetical protein